MLPPQVNRLGAVRILLVHALLGFFILLHKPAPGYTQSRACSANERLHLSILFDNSGSVLRRLNIGPEELSDWFRSVADALRPGDTFDAYSLASKQIREIPRVGRLVVERGVRDRSLEYSHQPDLIAERLLSDPDAHTDLAMSLGFLRDSLLKQEGDSPTCAKTVVLISDGSLDPHEEDLGSKQRDPASVAHEFIETVHAIADAGIRVYAVGVAADSANAFEPGYLDRVRNSPYHYVSGRIRTGRDLLTAAVGESRYLAWNSVTVEALFQGDTASLFSSMLALRGDTRLKPLLQYVRFGYLMYGFVADSAEKTGCREGSDQAHAADTVVITRVGRACLVHAVNPSLELQRQVFRRGRLNVLQYGNNRRFNFDATPDSVYDPLQILVTLNPDGADDGEPCTQATLLKALGHYGWARFGAERVHGRVLYGEGFSHKLPFEFGRIPNSHCYTPVQGFPSQLPGEGVFAIALEYPMRETSLNAMVVLRRASSPIIGASFHSVHPLLSALFGRHEYVVKGQVRLSDASFAHVLHDVNVGGDQLTLSLVPLDDCSERHVGAEAEPGCLSVERGLVVEDPPRAGLIMLNPTADGDCSNSSSRCHIVEISRSASVLPTFVLLLAFVAGAALELFPLVRRRPWPNGKKNWAALISVVITTGAIAAWFVDELAWKIGSADHLSWIHALDLLRIGAEVCIAAYSGELARHAVRSILELGMAS